MKLRSWLYRIARLLGWVNATRRGPKSLAKRFVRRATYVEVAKVKFLR